MSTLEASATGSERAARFAWRRLPVHERLHAMVAVAVGLALVCASVAGADALTHPVPWSRVAILLFLLPMSEAALLHVRFGGDSFSFTWGESCVVLGMALAKPAWVVLVAGPAVFAVHLAKRRGMQKAAFNAASFTIAAAIAALILTGLRDGPYSVTDRNDVLAMVLAVFAFSTASAVMTSAVVAVAQRTPFRIVIRRNALMVAIVYGGNMLVGGVVVWVGERSLSATLALLPLVLGLYLFYRGYLRAGEERDAWRQLVAATHELNDLDETRVAGSAITRAVQLLHANGAELVLAANPTRDARVYVVDGEDVVCRDLDHVEPVAEPGITAVYERPPSGSERGWTTTLVTALFGAEGPIGHLRLFFDGKVRLSRREEQVHTTFAHAVATTLLNVSLHDRANSEARKQAHAAGHDHLTGLANRLRLREETDRAIARANGCTAFLLLDLDNFKDINDTLGHGTGDLMLVHVAKQLRAAVGEAGLVARLGGDEFAVLATGLTGPAEAGAIADAMLVRLAEPLQHEGMRLVLQGSIGIACHPQDADDADELIRSADVAMYQAKDERGSWLRYDAMRDGASIEGLSLASELHTALEEHQLVLHFQPQIDLVTGSLIGAEALVRWNHPTRGLLQPAEFVHIAERSALVRPFTLRTLELAVSECAAWQAAGDTLTVAVNLCARSLLDPRLPDDVTATLQRHGLAPEQLVLEITETTAASDLDVVEEVLTRLHRSGVTISVDDFGTGYSSLAFLQRTSVHEVKVDRSFVAGMLDNDNAAALVRATVSLAHSLGARALAEGVESAALAEALVQLGCDAAQGYHFGRPVPSSQMRAIVQAARTPVVPLPRGATSPAVQLVDIANR